MRNNKANPSGLLLCAMVVFLSTVFEPAFAADEWNRFRGPNGTGIDSEGKSPETWLPNDYRWVIDLAGEGSSSPVIWKKKLFVTSSNQTAQERSLQCINAETGETQWQRTTVFKPYKKHTNNSFASSTHCCDESHVYVAWHSKESSPLIAYDHQGNKVWEYDLGPFSHGQGGATSPIVYNDLIIIAHDQKQPSYLLAVNRMTGEEAWKAVSYTHLRAHETVLDLVCRLLLEKKKNKENIQE